jgi:hypothetical protein
MQLAATKQIGGMTATPSGWLRQADFTAYCLLHAAG